MNSLKITERRMELGLTQKELAKLIGVSLKTIGNYENGGKIPDSKYAILHTVLNRDVVKEPESEYEISNTECIEKVKNLKNEIKLKDEIILLLKEKIELMKEQSN